METGPTKLPTARVRSEGGNEMGEELEQYTVGRPVSMKGGDGIAPSYHRYWTVMLGGEPVGPKFATKAEATYCMHKHYLSQ